MKKPRPFINYKEYINSSVWKQKRDAFIKHFGNNCFACGEIGTILHHRHYKNLGTEPPHQLVLLCKSCNDFVHGITQGNFTNTRKEMKLNLRILLRKYRTPTKSADRLGEREY